MKARHQRLSLIVIGLAILSLATYLVLPEAKKPEVKPQNKSEVKPPAEKKKKAKKPGKKEKSKDSSKTAKSK